MAFTDVPLLVPAIPYSSYAGSGAVLDGTTTKRAVIGMVPRVGTISKIAFRINSVSSPQQGLQVSIQTLDSSGNPSGSYYGNSQPAIIPSPAAGVVEATLQSAASASTGDLIAIVFEWYGTYSSGTVTLSNGTSSFIAHTRFQYIAGYSTSWNKASGYYPVALYYSDVSDWVRSAFVPPLASYSTYSLTNNAEAGNLINLPISVRVCGLIANISMSSTGAMELRVYSYPGGNETTQYVAGVPYHYNVDSCVFVPVYPELELTANSDYRIVVTGTSASAVNLLYATYSSLSFKKLAALGVYASRTYRSSGSGAWTDYSLSHAAIIPVISAIDIGSGGSVAGFPFPPHVIIT